MRRLRLAVPALVVLLAVTSAAAQTGSIEVRVSDAEGQALAGATVTISHEASFVKTTSQLTDKRGAAVFPVLRAGSGYAVRVSFPGFADRQEVGLRVKLNSPLRLGFQMIEQIEERIQVTAEREVIDLDKTETSTRFGDDFIADLPVPGRYYTNIITMAPGVQDANGDGNPNVHGSRSRDFQALVGGVSNVDPLTGQWMSRISPNSIEELEVITAGAGVEFGRAQGGYARIIQKQGNNAHEGVFEFLWTSSKLDGRGSNSLTRVIDGDVSASDFETLQPIFQLSGPLVKDKLWYRLSYERLDSESPVDVLDGIELFVRDTENRDAQITWQISPRNKLAFNYRSDPLEESNFGVSNVIPSESSRSRERTGETWSATWTAPYSPRVLVESTVAWQDLTTGQGPSVEGVINDCVAGSNVPFLRTAQCLDLGSNLTSGSYYRTDTDHRQRLTVKGQATVYAGRFWGMNHQFKLGFGVENERYFRDLEQSAQITYQVVPDGLSSQGVALARVAVPEQDGVRATGTNWGIYAEDQLKPFENLTVTVGARVDQEELNSEGREPFFPTEELIRFFELRERPYYSAGDAAVIAFTGYEDFPLFKQQLKAQLCKDVSEESIGNCEVIVEQSILTQSLDETHRKRRNTNINITNTNVSPFLSVAWSPWSHGKTALKASARRYYNSVPLLVPLQELEPVLTDIDYEVNLFTLETQLSGAIEPTITVRTVDRNLRTPYQDEYTLSFEQELWPETSLRLTYINREYRDQIQDINSNLDTGDWGRCALNPFTGDIELVGSPGGGSGSDRTIEDPVTGEFYKDTDPGIGDGRVDDCVGATVDLGFGVVPRFVTRPDGFFDLYIQNPYWADILLVGNFNSIDYEAYVLELVRRQYRSWEMNASYTWSEAVGDGEDFFQELGNDPSRVSDLRGFQSYDQRHVVKLNATTITPWGMRLGTSVTWQSGLPYSIVKESVSPDLRPSATGQFGVAGERLRQGFVTGVRNDQRNRAYWNVDVKATKEFDLGRQTNLQVSAEVFNVLDDDTYLIYNEFFERGQQVNGVNEALRRFGRQWQLGMKVAW